METIFHSIRERKFINRGFLRGCFCPIYGFGAVLTLQFSKLVSDTYGNTYFSTVTNILLAVIVVTILEYITGFFLEKIFDYKWWDYSDNALNLRGYICIKYSFLWGVLAFVLVKFVHPVVSEAAFSVDFLVKECLMLALLIYFVVDTSYSIVNALELRKTILNYSNDEEYIRCVCDLINHEKVQSMKNYMQHGNISCLDHSRYVSYCSFVICKRFKFNYYLAARGGLLHDFFLYDWHATKPYKGMHGFIHPHIALQNANKYFNLNEREKDIIEKHMWPLTFKLPKYKETYVVLLVDKYCAFMETVKFYGN